MILHDADTAERNCAECGVENEEMFSCDSCGKILCEACLSAISDRDAPFDVCEMCARVIEG